MKSLCWFLFFAVFSVSFAATPVTTKVPAKTPAPKAAVKKAPAPKTGTKSATTTKKPAGKSVASRKGKGPARPVASTLRSRQAQPTPERYKEIQEALTAKGYLKSEPNGVWDAQSSEALRQFQNDNKLSPTGKLSSASLIGLGLGPKTGAPSNPPEPTPAPNAPRP